MCDIDFMPVSLPTVISQLQWLQKVECWISLDSESNSASESTTASASSSRTATPDLTDLTDLEEIGNVCRVPRS